MYFNAAALLALLPAFSAATSYTKPQADDNTSPALVLRDGGRNTCDISTFTEISQPAANQPLVSDCEAMLQKIQTDREWIVWQGGARQLVTSGTCSFNAIVQGTDGSKGVVGNQDVIDLVTDSINKYGKDGHVSTQGTIGVLVNAAGGVPCNKFGDGVTKVNVDWTLAHA